VSTREKSKCPQIPNHIDCGVSKLIIDNMNNTGKECSSRKE